MSLILYFLHLPDLATQHRCNPRPSKGVWRELPLAWCQYALRELPDDQRPEELIQKKDVRYETGSQEDTVER